MPLLKFVEFVELVEAKPQPDPEVERVKQQKDAASRAGLLLKIKKANQKLQKLAPSQS